MKRNTIFLIILLTFSLSFVSGKQVLTLVSPNGGEKLVSGSTVHIIWKYTDKNSGGNIILVLYKNGIKFLTISDSAADTGSFSWKIPVNVPSDDKYRIRIRSTENLSLNDFSDGDFSIRHKK